MNSTTPRYATIDTRHGPVVLPIPNEVTRGDDFYVSFNAVDTGHYGRATTALVVGQGSAFYTLNGDHRAAYAPLIAKGFAACLAYFQEHIGEANEYSDKVPA